MKYIDAGKLIAEIEKRRDNALERQKNLEKIGQETVLNESIAFELNKIISLITSLQQEQSECVWIHKKYNREYRIVSDNARLKNSNGEWIDCVIYAPLYENEFEMFAREKDSFYKEFERK